MHIIRTQDFTEEFLNKIFYGATKAATEPFWLENACRGMIVASLFFEPSTRTRFSFESAAIRVGAHVIGTENGGVFSSVSKGETLEDTIRMVGSYADCIVLRHSAPGAAERAAAVSDVVPIINAGCSFEQHPTQSLTDVYTIHNELGCLDNLTVALCGDLLFGRTVHSLAYLMSKFKGTKLRLISPEFFSMPAEITRYLEEEGVPFEVYRSLSPEALNGVDVLYQTRVQKERMPQGVAFEGDFTITPGKMSWMPEKSLLLHPLPRVGEITTDVDSDPRAAYFRQAANGLYVRAALLSYLLRDKVREGELSPKFKAITTVGWTNKMDLTPIKLRN